MIEVQSASFNDICEIIEIHLAAFPQFFLTSLGKRFLALYYQSVLKHTQGILLVSKEENRIIGFCAGTILSAGFNSRIIKSDFLSYAKEGLSLLFTRPTCLWHLLKNMSKEDSIVGDKGEYAELLSIGVNPDSQRTGAGKAMLFALEEETRKRGCKRISLTTDYFNNEKAIGFYRSLGYDVWYDFITYPKRRMYRLMKNL